MRETNASIDQMIEALHTPSRELTKWEENFLASIEEQYQKNKKLSERQVEILDKIYAEKTND